MDHARKRFNGEEKRREESEKASARRSLCVVVSLGEFLVRYVARVMSAEVHETAEISPPLPSEEWIHTRPERRTGPYMHAEMHALALALARVPTKRLCATHDRELAPPSAPVGQSSLLTHTRPWSRSHTRTTADPLFLRAHGTPERREIRTRLGSFSIPFLLTNVSRDQIRLRFYRSLMSENVCVCVCVRL